MTDQSRLPKQRLFDLVEACRLWVLLALVDARLAVFPWAMNRAWILRSARPVPGLGPRTQARVGRLARLVVPAARFRWRRGSPCLVLSLALRDRLAAGGVPSSVVFGARRAAMGKKGIETHARLKLGAVIVDPSAPGEAFHDFL